MDKIKLTIPCEECLLRPVCVNKYKLLYANKQSANLSFEQAVHKMIKCIDECEYLESFFNDIPKNKLKIINFDNIIDREYNYDEIRLWSYDNGFLTILSFIRIIKKTPAIIYDIPLKYFNSLSNLIIRFPIQFGRMRHRKHELYYHNKKYNYHTNGLLLVYTKNKKLQIVYYKLINSSLYYDDIYDFLYR